jgi:translation initiation factor 2 alpha subunit (eIF-2alpha)|tara:strand:- start:995 stop:1699 length:705 start_codon:yes stop_codon:yes gene_type:complete
MELVVGDVVMCTVDRIERTTVFVKIHRGGEGSIILPEIAPGRIRNLRDYVVPKKQIICKVLRKQGNRIELSLRRVTPKEQKEVKEHFKQEKSYKNILKSIIKDKADQIVNKIEENERLYDFVESTKENSKELEKLIGKEDSKKFLEIINAQKQKTISIKKEITLRTTDRNGLKLIKDLLREIKGVDIRYLSAGKYTLKLESNDAKQADNKLKEILEKIEKEAKKNKIEFNLKEK